MAQDTTPAIIVYQGDGSNSVFDVPFDKGYYGEVKVLFVRRGLADYTYQPNTFTVSGRLYAWQNGGAKIYTHTPNPAIGAPTYNSSDVEQAETVSAIAGQTITVDSLVYSRAVQHDISSNMKLTWTGDMLEVGDFICIVRDTERGQPYEMPNNQKHIEMALDNLERQIQEVKDATDNALKIDPSHDIPDSHKMNPIDWLHSIIRCMDFSVRAVRLANGWFDYSADDPNIADADKTWVHLLNTDNVKNIKEVITIDPDTLRESHCLYYVDKDGVERAISMDMSVVEEAIEKAEQAYKAVNEHIQDKDNPHEVTKAQVGLDNVDNTADLDKPVVVKSDTMPVASADYLGKAYLYYGNTSAVYQHGYIYECVLIPNDTLIFTPNGLSCTWADLSAFLQNETPDYDTIVGGTMTYIENADLWQFVGKDASDNTVLTYQQYTGDWEQVGFTFIGTFDDGDIVSFNRITTPTYVWQRMDVQPSGSRGRFLDLWDCATGLAMGNPPISPFEYKTGDYFIVGNVSTATPPVNYKPDGASYVIGQASSVVEINEVAVDDTYFFDGTTWKLQSNSTKTLTFANIAGSPYDNTNLASALNNKVDKTSTASQVYATGSDGAQTTLSYGASVSDLMIVRRPVGGQINVPLAPTDNAHATSKKYVDDGLAEKQDTISDLATIRSGAAAGATAVQPSGLATVATTGSYNDLTNKPTLGTAAAADTTDFATAAQGALANTATQPGDLATVATTGQYSDLSGKPTIPTTLAALTGDVAISTPTDGQSLLFDALSGKWKNTSSTTSVGFDGITGSPEDNAALANALSAKADVATTYNKTEVDALLTALIRPGTVFPFAGLTTPNGYLVCDGSAVSRTTYADLFAAIGTYYGDGDGSTTFNLPNFMNGYPLSNGSSSDISSGYVTANASLPNITGNFNAYTYNIGNPGGAFGASIQTAKVLNSGSQNNLNINTFSFSAQASSGRYSRTDGLVYPTRNILRGGWIIKY